LKAKAGEEGGNKDDAAGLQEEEGFEWMVLQLNVAFSCLGRDAAGVVAGAGARDRGFAWRDWIRGV
jgi:hypothetical protein